MLALVGDFFRDGAPALPIREKPTNRPQCRNGGKGTAEGEKMNATMQGTLGHSAMLQSSLGQYPCPSFSNLPGDDSGNALLGFVYCPSGDLLVLGTAEYFFCHDFFAAG